MSVNETPSGAPAGAPPLPRLPVPDGLGLSWPPGRTRAGKAGPLSPAARLNAERLVVSLWIACRAARRLRRALGKHRPGRCPRPGAETCPHCGHRDDRLCPACSVLDVLNELIGPRPARGVLLGEAAEELMRWLPWVEINRRVFQLEQFSAARFAADEVEGEVPCRQQPAGDQDTAAAAGQGEAAP